MLFNRDSQKNQSRADDVRRAMEQWQRAKEYLESVSEPDLVDYAVFEAEAARRKYMLLLRRYAQEQVYRE